MNDPWAGKGFGWSNMFVAPEGDPRGVAPVAGERAVLRAYLSFQRGTLELKCADLTPEQLCARAIPSTELTLLGLVRHMATVEYGWFQIALQTSCVRPSTAAEGSSAWGPHAADGRPADSPC